jgi:hypothetical protein
VQRAAQLLQAPPPAVPNDTLEPTSEPAFLKVVLAVFGKRPLERNQVSFPIAQLRDCKERWWHHEGIWPSSSRKDEGFLLCAGAHK